MENNTELKFDLKSEAEKAKKENEALELAAKEESEKEISTLNATEAAVAEVMQEKVYEENPDLDMEQLSEEDKKKVDAFVDLIDIRDTDNMLLYGSTAQKKVVSFSDSALENVKNKDSGEVGELLVTLIGKLKGFNADSKEPTGIKKLFYNSKNHMESIKEKFNTIETNVESIASSLENHQIALLKDISMFEELYATNTEYFKELTMYIIAGQKKLSTIRNTELKELQDKAKESGDPVLAQQASDLSQLCDRFEKKIHDLKLTRQVSLQMAPQIRLLQNNDSLLVERIQSTLSNTLPLWKSQMVISLGLHRTTQALKAQTEVTNMTNELLKKNAATLKMGTVETARQSERGIVDIQTLISTNQSLIDTINEVMNIQKEGHNKRVEAEKELLRMEKELKDKLLDINKK